MRPVNRGSVRFDGRVVSVWWIACLLWSSTFMAIKVGVTQVPPLTLAWLRLLIAAAVLCPIVLMRRRFVGVTRGDAVHIALAGVLLLGVNYGLIFWGAQFVRSGTVALFQPAVPVLALFFGWCAGTETTTARKIAALASGTVGVILTFQAEAGAPGVSSVLGAAAVLGGAACVAAAYVWLKTFAPTVDPLFVVALQCVAGLVPLMIAGLVIDGSPLRPVWTLPALAALLYLSLVASVVAFWLNYWLLQRMDTSAMLMMSIAEVPIAVALGAIFLHELVTSGSLVGGACILAGAALTLTSPPRAERSTA